MSKGKKGSKHIKIVDYRSVNLAWLVVFRDKVFANKLAPEIELVVAQELIGEGSPFEVHKGDTLCLTGSSSNAYSVTRPYGDVRKGEVPRAAVAAKKRTEWTTEDVAEYVVKRACLKDECTFLEVIEKPKRNVSKKEYKGTFVSQARKCLFADLVGSLEYFYNLKKAEIAEQFVWLDIFSANQPKLTARNVEEAVRKENERQLTEGLHIAIANFEQRVMFMDKWDGATPLTRAWCVWEVLGVAKAERQLEIALPKSEHDRFIRTLTENFDSIIKKTSSVDVEAAQCFNQVDLAAIHKAIREESSFQVLNDIVKSQLRLWVASAGKLQVEEEEQKKNPDERAILLLANQAGLTYRAQGDFANAELLLSKALNTAEAIAKDRENDPSVATQLNNLALLFQDQGRVLDADEYFRRALAIARMGTDGISLATYLNNHAGLLQDAGNLEAAEIQLREALDIFKQAKGEDHQRSVATTMNNIAQLMRAQGKAVEAEGLMREVVAVGKKVLGTDHPEVASWVNNLAQLLNIMEKYDESEKLYKEALEIRLKVLGDDHPDTATTFNDLGNLYSKTGDFVQAESFLLKAIDVYRKRYGNVHTLVAAGLMNMAGLLRAQGKLSDAEKIMREVVSIDQVALGNGHPRIATDLNNLAILLRAQDPDSKEADKLGKEAIQIATATLGNDHPLTQQYIREWS